MKNWFVGIVFSLLALVSCNEDMLNPDGSLDAVPTLKSTVFINGTETIVCGTETFPLTAGQTYVVGNVIVSNDETNLYVTYKLNYEGHFGSLHLWVGTDLATTPKNSQGTPIPGQFPYKMETGEETYLNGSWIVTQYTFTIPLSTIPNYSKCGNTLYFLAHAETTCDINGDGDYHDEGEGSVEPGTWITSSETAWAGSTVGTGTERWFFYDDFIVACCGAPVVTGTLETAFARGTHVFITPLYDKKTGGIIYKNNPEKLPFLSLTQNRWGWAIDQQVTLVNFVGPTTRYTMKVSVSCGFRCSNTYEVGYADMWYDETNFYVKMHLNSPYTFAQSWTNRFLMLQLNGVNGYLNPGQIQSLSYLAAGSPTTDYTATIPLNSIPNWTGLGAPIYIRNEVGTNIGPGVFVNPLSNYYTDQFINTLIPPTTVEEVEYPVYAGAGLNNLSNGTLVGKAIVSYDGAIVKVKYDLDEGYEMEELHIYANDAKPITVAPGQYGFTQYFDPMVNDFETQFEVPDTDGNGRIWLILHAVVNI